MAPQRVEGGGAGGEQGGRRRSREEERGGTRKSQEVRGGATRSAEVGGAAKKIIDSFLTNQRQKFSSGAAEVPDDKRDRIPIKANLIHEAFIF